MKNDKKNMKFSIKLKERNISKDRLIEDLQNVSKKLGSKRVTVLQYLEHGQFSQKPFLREFVSWNKALEAAELDLSNRLNIPNDELFENLANVWQELCRQPLGREIADLEVSKFSLSVYEKRFGSWNKALEAFIKKMDSENTEGDIKLDASAGQELAESNTNNLSKNYNNSSDNKRDISIGLRFKIFNRDSFRCKLCGSSPATKIGCKLHVDHILPWSKGGKTVTENLRTLCADCNIGRGNRYSE